jgi:hypothetical protein
MPFLYNLGIPIIHKAQQWIEFETLSPTPFEPRPLFLTGSYQEITGALTVLALDRRGHIGVKPGPRRPWPRRRPATPVGHR